MRAGAAGVAPLERNNVVLSGAPDGPPRYVDDEGYRGGFTRAEVDELRTTMEGDHLGWSAATARRVIGRRDRPELVAELVGSFARTRAHLAVEFARAIFLSDVRDRLAEARVPTLVAQTYDDPVVPVSVGDYLHRAIPGSRLVRLRSTGHFPHLGNPEEAARVVRSFLAEVGT